MGFRAIAYKVILNILIFDIYSCSTTKRDNENTCVFVDDIESISNVVSEFVSLANDTTSNDVPEKNYTVQQKVKMSTKFSSITPTGPNLKFPDLNNAIGIIRGREKILNLEFDKIITNGVIEISKSVDMFVETLLSSINQPMQDSIDQTISTVIASFNQVSSTVTDKIHMEFDLVRMESETDLVAIRNQLLSDFDDFIDIVQRSTINRINELVTEAVVQIEDFISQSAQRLLEKITALLKTTINMENITFEINFSTIESVKEILTNVFMSLNDTFFRSINFVYNDMLIVIEFRFKNLVDRRSSSISNLKNTIENVIEINTLNLLIDLKFLIDQIYNDLIKTTSILIINKDTELFINIQNTINKIKTNIENTITLNHEESLEELYNELSTSEKNLKDQIDFIFA